MKNRRTWLYLGVFLAVNIGIYAYTLIRKAEAEGPRYGHRFPKRVAYDAAGNEVHWGMETAVSSKTEPATVGTDKKAAYAK